MTIRIIRTCRVEFEGGQSRQGDMQTVHELLAQQGVPPNAEVRMFATTDDASWEGIFAEATWREPDEESPARVPASPAPPAGGVQAALDTS